MTLIDDPSQIVEMALDAIDIRKGIGYGVISHAHTYDRMGAQARGDMGKAIFRIVAGKGVQNAFERYVEQSLHCTLERDAHDYKTEDYWDVRFNGMTIDVKSNDVFSDMLHPPRRPVTPAMILNSSLGDKWETFFPMLIPQDQFNSDPKDIYVFAISTTVSSKSFPDTLARPRCLIATAASKDPPTNQILRTVRRAKLVRERIRSHKTFGLTLSRVGQNSMTRSRTTVVIGFADEKGKARRAVARIHVGQSVKVKRLTAFHYLRVPSLARVSPPEDPIFRIVFNDVDDIGDIEWKVPPRAFTDVWMYDANVLIVGWIRRREFEEARRKYPAFGPSSDYLSNGPHHDVKARGILSMRGFCYYYPPYYLSNSGRVIPYFRAGTKNHNYYCLPKDLNPMSSLVEAKN
jgi:hypothetical protein